MLIKELIEALSKMDPETEVMLYKQGAYDSPSFSTTKILIKKGYAVRDPEESGSFYTKAKGNGMFVDEDYANQVMDDGQKFLDLTSPTIHPVIQLEIPRLL